MIIRILIWSLFDSEVTIDDLRDALPDLEAPSTWLWSEIGERFGALSFDDEEEEAPALALAGALIGRDPDVYEEFDAL